jgi:nucleotide-binding universal stress UspA family protein
MFKNVLVGVDGSANGRDAVALASRLADPQGKLTLANVRIGNLRPLYAVTDALLAEEQAASEKLLEQARAEAHLDAELASIVSASPGSGLHRHAEALGADLIVVGSCARGALGRAMVGDDTRAALNGSPCAVAIAARGYAAEAAPIAKVGVGYNDSPESKAALEVARDVAASTGASVEVLEVVSIPTYAYTGLMPATIGDGVDAMLAEAAARLGHISGVHARAVYGLTGEELAAFSDEVDLLVVGSRSYGPLRRLMLGSTSDFLERHARSPLLVLPRVALHAHEDAPVEEHRSGVGAVA